MSELEAAHPIARELAKLDDALDRALMAQDAGAAAALFAADAVLGESGMEDVVGRRAIRDFLAGANERRRVAYHRLTQEQVLLAGDRAIVVGRFDETKEPLAGGPPVHERGRAVTFWKRQSDGAWRIERLVVSDLPVSR
jgi:uncharacterized protein (TIGR02246 family)